jgi:hypothetical protein
MLWLSDMGFAMNDITSEQTNIGLIAFKGIDFLFVPIPFYLTKVADTVLLLDMDLAMNFLSSLQTIMFDAIAG